jgi:hypothetical protein
MGDGRRRECLDYNANAASSRYTIMIWLFERGDRVARLVTRVEAAGVYVLEMEWSDGLMTTERFSDVTAFTARIHTLEQQLVAEQWKPAGNSPQLIAEDWWKP